MKPNKPITYKEWNNILYQMKQYNRSFGFVDYDRGYLLRFFDQDPCIDGVNALYVTQESIQEYMLQILHAESGSDNR